jgi:hypothetical protein
MPHRKMMQNWMNTTRTTGQCQLSTVHESHYSRTTPRECPHYIADHITATFVFSLHDLVDQFVSFRSEILSIFMLNDFPRHTRTFCHWRNSLTVNSNYGGTRVSTFSFDTRKVTTPFPKTAEICSVEKPDILDNEWTYRKKTKTHQMRMFRPSTTKWTT